MRKTEISSKQIMTITMSIGILILILFFNPFGRNKAGQRQVIENPISGKVSIRFKQGWYWKGPFSRITNYPDVLTTMYTDKKIKEEVTSLNGPFEIRFNDATKANAQATVRWRLPIDEVDMKTIHSEFRSPQKLAETMLSRYTVECLKYSAQLMESETHYSGGMSQLSEDFQDQLQYGQYLIDQVVETFVDSTTRETERLYIRKKRIDDNGKPLRILSDVQQFNISVALATIDNVDYESQVDEKLKMKIEASTRESVSKQNLVTAQQEALTAEQEGKRRLVEIEYEELQKQRKEVIQRQTEVLLAQEDITKQKASVEAAALEGKAIKLKADAEAYAKEKVMKADGALEMKLKTYENVNARYADAIEKYQGNWVPSVVMGSENGDYNGANSLINMLSIKTAKELALNPNITK